MWRNSRYDLQDYSSLELASNFTTQGYPIRVSAEDLTRNNQKFYTIGHHMDPQVFGSMWGSQTAAKLNTTLDHLKNAGVNVIGVMGLETHGLGQSGENAGRPVGCFDIGYRFSGVSTRNWAVGEKCWTTDGSSIRRVYQCITAGVGSGSTGPTGTLSDITNGATHWKFLYNAFSVYNEQFFRGDGTSAGFDYFLDACSRRGIYVIIRFNGWSEVFTGQTTYPLNGGGNLSAYGGLWHFDGESSTPTLFTYVKNHLTQFLDRVNSVNGRRYGDDHTIFGFNVWNETGHAYTYLNTTSTSSPSGNTFDRMCFTGSPTSISDSEPNGRYVAAYDSAFLTWYTATYGSTPNADYGKFNTLPCYAYTGLNAGAANNVAQRDTYRAGALANDYLWRKRVIRFWQETETNMVSNLKTWLRTKSGHALLIPGQSQWMFPQSIIAGDVADVHLYDSNTATGVVTTGNTQTITTTTAPTSGFAYTVTAGGTLTFTGVTPDGSHPLVVGQKIRWTKVSNPAVTGVSTVATTGSPWTCTGVDADYATAAADIGGTIIDCTVTLPNVSYDYWSFHTEPPVDTATTRVHVNMATGTTETNADITGGWVGQANYGTWDQDFRSSHPYGMPKICTETGSRGLADPTTAGLYRTTYVLMDLLTGGSGPVYWAWINASTQPGSGEHIIPGDGCSVLATQLAALMSRPGVITQLPVLDATQVTNNDVHDWYSKKNTTDTYARIGCGYMNLVSTLELTGFDTQYYSFMHSRLRHRIAGSTAKTDVTYTHATNGWTHDVLNNITTGRLYHNRDVGTISYESSKIKIIIGRIKGTTTTNECTGMKLTCIDGQYWYGLACWITLDGSDLGVGRSALYHWMMPREEVQRFRRFQMDTGPRTSRVEMLDGDYSGSSSATIQPGVVLRNGLEVQLTSPRTLTISNLVQGRRGKYYTGYSNGTIYLQPRDPLLILE